MGMFTSMSNAVSSTVSVIDKSMSGLGATLNIYSREQHENDLAHELVSGKRLEVKIINNLTDCAVRVVQAKEQCSSASCNFDTLLEEATQLLKNYNSNNS